VWLPRTGRPARGWPALLFQHGCGGTGDEHAPHAALAARLGLAGIIVPGPIALRGGENAWPADGFQTTHDYLQGALALGPGLVDIDRSKVCYAAFPREPPT
jgi:hypothetical protein